MARPWSLGAPRPLSARLPLAGRDGGVMLFLLLLLFIITRWLVFFLLNFSLFLAFFLCSCGHFFFPFPLGDVDILGIVIVDDVVDVVSLEVFSTWCGRWFFLCCYPYCYS